MRPIRALLPLFFAAILTGASCAPSSTPPDQSADGSPAGAKTGVAGSQESDWKAIEALEAQAKALATTAGCPASGDCRAAPVGSRACGGPRYYLPYCAKTADSASLFGKLDEVAKAEQAYNAKYQLVSTCEFRMPPTVESVGGSCVAK